MATSISLRLQFSRFSDPAKVAEQILALHDASPFEELTVMTYIEEHASGHPPLDEVQAWVDHCVAYSEPVAKRGVRLNANPGHTIGQGDQGRRLRADQPWQPMVGLDGTSCEFQVCYLDPTWQAYYRDVISLYAMPRRFRTIWIEDDIRFHNHAPLKWGGCFCPLHIKAFNDRYGLNVTREQLVKRCLQPGPPHEWRGLWMDVWQSTLLEQIVSWRNVIAPFGSRLGLMSSEMGQHAAEGRRWGDWWTALTLPGEAAVHRPHFWDYSETVANGLADAVAKLDQNHAVQPPGVISEPEIETSMFGQWFRPLRQTAAECQVAVAMGSTGLNLSLFDYTGNDLRTDQDRFSFLKTWRPSFDWLAEQCGEAFEPTGLRVTWSEDVGRRAPAIHRPQSGGVNPLALSQGGGEGWQSLVHATRGWAQWAGANGIAFTSRPGPGVQTLAGNSVWAMNDDMLLHTLSGDALIDAHAAEILIERGFGRHIGFSSGRRVTMSDVPFKLEQLTDPAFTRYPGHCISQMFAENHTLLNLFQGQMLPEAKAISRLLGAHEDVLGHGPVIFDNALGGRIAVILRDVHQTRRFTLWDADQLQHLLRYVDRADTVGVIHGGAHTLGMFLRNNARWRVMIWNASDDPCHAIGIRRPAGCPPLKAAWQIGEGGHTTPVHVDNDRLQLTNALRRWDMILLRTTD